MGLVGWSLAEWFGVMRLNRLSIKLRLIICVVLIAGISLVLVAAVITRRNLSEARDSGFAYAQEIGVRNAAQVQAQLAAAFNRFVEKVAGTVRGIAGSAADVRAAADRLADGTNRLSADVVHVSDNLGTAAEATQTVNSSVQSVAAGAEQMNAAIAEIASSAAQAARVATDARSVAESTNGQVTQLGTATEEIGDRGDHRPDHRDPGDQYGRGERNQ
jgi:methyl-accepting chemotaxis protein